LWMVPCVTNHVGVMVELGSNGHASTGIGSWKPQETSLDTGRSKLSAWICDGFEGIVCISVNFADAKGRQFPLRACI
jgi:hypothetical protein